MRDPGEYFLFKRYVYSCPWYPRGMGSRTSQREESKDVQDPYVKWCSPVGRPYPQGSISSGFNQPWIQNAGIRRADCIWLKFTKDHPTEIVFFYKKSYIWIRKLYQSGQTKLSCNKRTPNPRWLKSLAYIKSIGYWQRPLLIVIMDSRTPTDGSTLGNTSGWGEWLLWVLSLLNKCSGSSRSDDHT